MKHYTLTNNTKEAFEKTLTQIKRLSDGKLGGWIEKEDNLSQDGSWIDETSFVYGDSVVSGKSQVLNNSRVENSLVENSNVTTNTLTANPGKHPITVCDNKTSIGCEIHTHDYWLEHIDEIGAKHGYTEEDIELYKAVLTLLIERKRKMLLTKQD